MALTLRWLDATTLPIRGESLKPETFAAMSPADAARLPVGLGNRRVQLGELFHVTGDFGEETLTIEGNLKCVQGIGAGMTSGTLVVHGSVGPMLGSRMSGGTVDVHGSAGDWVGAEMSGGLIRVRSNAGHFVGAAYPGSRLGMKEGVILIDGSAGDHVGLSMRRGLIAVRGDAGESLGRSLIAGTILLGGSPGPALGAGMKRGSLLLLNNAPEELDSLLPTFFRAGSFRPSFLVVYRRQLDAWDFPLPVSDSVLMAPCERYNGDTLVGGQGEILLIPRS